MSNPSENTDAGSPAAGQQQDSAQPAMSERELIEAAARAAPAAKGTTSDRAMNIIQASVIQREAITQAYEAQKKSINDAVQKQRVSAMEQMNTARNQLNEREAREKMQQAQSSNVNPASATAPQAGAIPGARPATQAQHPTAAQPQPAPSHATTPAANPGLAPEAPIANELANTIRAIISEEVDKQLKELLAIYTAQGTAPPPTDGA